MAKKANGKKKPVSKKPTTSAKKATKKPTTKSKLAAKKEVKAKVVAKKAGKPADKKMAKKAAPAKPIDKKKAAKLEAEAKKAAAAAAKKAQKSAKPEVKVETKKSAKDSRESKETKAEAKTGKGKASEKMAVEKAKDLKGKKGKKSDEDDTLIEFQEEIIIEEVVDDFDDEEFKDVAPKAGPRALAKLEDPDEKELPAVKVKALSEEMDVTEALNKVRHMDFFIDESDECIEKGCDSPATTGNYCRYHYIRNWQDIKKREGILKEGKLHQFIEELLRKYSQKQVEAMQADLSDDKNFFGVLKELNIELEDDNFEEADDELLDDDTDIAFETKPGKLGFIED